MGVHSDGLIRRLRGRLRRLPEDAPSTAPTLEQVQDAVGGRADDLASLLLAVSRSDDAELIAGTSQALIAANPRLWVVLDASARRSPWHARQWTDTVAHRLVTDQPEPLNLLLAACHPDGFVREAAVAAISELDDVVALPALALRAADWVPEVRYRARQACRRYLDDAPIKAITVLAPVAFVLRARLAGRWLADAVDSVLRDGPPEAMTTGLTAKDWSTRRTAHTIALNAGRLAVDQMVCTATTDSDLPIRIMCAEAAIRASRADGNRDVARRLLASGTAAVRAEAVHALGTLGEVGPAIEALSDRNALVRATAQAIVRRAGADPATRYRALLAEQQPPHSSVIAGLGETGTPADADLLLPWLVHPESRGRAEAVRALRRRGYTSPQQLLPMLTDAVSSVTRQVTLSLLDQAATLDEHALRPLLHQERPFHVRVAASRLLRAHDTWARLSVDLQLFNDPVDTIRAHARTDLGNWLRYEAATAYSVPTGPRAQELSALITDTEATLGTGQMTVLRFHLGLTG